MRRFELWNEPDIPLYRDAPNSGHGFVGTVHEFVQLNLPVLAAAIEAVEARKQGSPVVEAPAAYSPWPMSRYGATLSDLLINTNGLRRHRRPRGRPGRRDLRRRRHRPDPPRWQPRLPHRDDRRRRPRAGCTSTSCRCTSTPTTRSRASTSPSRPRRKLLYGRSPYASPETYAEAGFEWSRAFPGRERDC
ncbi:MAG: hypothetical protein R2746_12520 [Acidimicrobiales bacterium]